MSDHERIRDLVDRWIAAGRNRYPAKQAPFDVEDGGVPPAMWDGAPDTRGWVRWKAIASPVTSADLDALERRIGQVLPALVRAWLSTRCAGPLEMTGASLPPLWSDAPLRKVAGLIEAWSPLERARYVAIGAAGNDMGPLCLDLGQDDAQPIVAFDHESLLELGRERAAERAHVAPLAEPRWPSFGSLLEALELSFRPLPSTAS